MKTKQILQTVGFFATLLTLSLCLFLLPPRAVSEDERRPLTQFQTYGEKKAEAEKAGQVFGVSQYFAFLDGYMLDQFPLRDTLRFVKGTVKKYVLFQRDNNGYYYADGSLGRMDTEISDKAISDSVSQLNRIYDRYFAKNGSEAFYSVIPDKNYYLAEKNGIPHLDYDELYGRLEGGFREGMERVDIRELLSADSYYRTDPHWEQSALLPVADRLLTAMGAPHTASEHEWTVTALSPYYGTYYGQAALPVGGEELRYLSGEQLAGVTVEDLATGESIPVYAEEKFGSRDPYDVFPGGSMSAVLRIKNPNAARDKQLVVFRDSFGSSLIPLLISEYSEILAVDIRCVSPSALSGYARFRHGCDVLFLFSASVLNTYGAFLA